MQRFPLTVCFIYEDLKKAKKYLRLKTIWLCMERKINYEKISKHNRGRIWSSFYEV